MIRGGDCERADAVLERLDRPGEKPAEDEEEWLAGHLESCPDCGAPPEIVRALSEALRSLDPPLPDEAFFRTSRHDILARVRTENVADVPTKTHKLAAASRRAHVARRSKPAAERGALVRQMALAAGIVLAVGVWLAGPHRGPAPAPTAATHVVGGIVSVDELDVDQLVASEDVWLVARRDPFAVESADFDPAWRFEDMSDEELDALEGMFGSAPSHG